MTSVYAPKGFGGKAASLAANEKPPKVKPLPKPKKVPLPPSLSPKTDTRFNKPKGPVKNYGPAVPVNTAKATKAAPTHMSFGQAVKLANAAKARAKVQHPNAPDWALGQLAKQAMKPGPVGDATAQLNALQLKQAKQAGVHQTAAMGVLNQTLHPAVDLLQGAAGQRHVNLGGAVSDVANIASNLLSPEKAGAAAGIIGLRGLKGAKIAKDVTKGAEDVAPRVIPVTHDPVANYSMPAISHSEMVSTMPRDGQHLYHAASAEDFAAIKKRGLLPGKTRPGETTGVYFGQDGTDVLSLRPGRKRAGDVYLRVKKNNVQTQVTDMYEPGSGFEEHVSPNAVPPQHLEYLGADNQWHPVASTVTPEQQLKSILSGKAGTDYKQQNVGYSAARGAVSKKLAAIQANPNLSASEKIAAGRVAMHGELPKVVVNGEAREMSQDSLEHLLTTAFNHPQLREFEKHRVADSLTKLIKEGRPLQPNELKLMNKVWPDATVQSLKSSWKDWHVWKDHALSVLNIPRAMQSTLDASFGLRQGLVSAFYDPKNWWKNYSHSFSYLNKYTGSGEEGYQALMKDVHADPNFERFQVGGLAVTDLEREVGLREEPFQSNLAEKMTIKGHGPGNAIRGSGRAFTGAAVGTRRAVANNLLELAHSKGYNIDDEKTLKDIMSFVNAITGYGNLPGKVLKESAPLLNALFFSPHLLGSRIQMLGQPFNMALLRRNPLLYRQYLKANAKTFGTLGLILASVRKFVPGAKVNMNPRSSDFGKIKVGDHRIDLGGGFNQIFHQIGMQVTGEKISTTTGELTSLTSGQYGKSTRQDEFMNFLIGKEAPSPGILTDFMSNKNPNHFGQPFNWADEAKSKLVPLSFQDASGAFSDPGHMNKWLAGLLAYAGSGSGVGIQTYGPAKPKHKGGSPYAPGGGGSFSSPYAP